jgi:hypothetical protein
MSTILRELMRHERIETTMNAMWSINAEAMADELWAVIGGNLGSAPNENETEVSKTT